MMHRDHCPSMSHEPTTPPSPSPPLFPPSPRPGRTETRVTVELYHLLLGWLRWQRTFVRPHWWVSIFVDEGTQGYSVALPTRLWGSADTLARIPAHAFT